MSESAEGLEYVASRPESSRSEPAKRLPFDIRQLSVTGLVIVCELEDRPPRNVRPSLHVKITQYLRLSDDSMIRLDMDRGMSSFKGGYVRPVSWKRASADVVEEVLTLVKADGPQPGELPWEEYTEAANLRGISVVDAALRDLPCSVMLSDELAAVFEF